MLKTMKTRICILWNINRRLNFNNIKDLAKTNIIMKKTKCIKIKLYLNNNNSRKALTMGSKNSKNHKLKKKKNSKILIIQVSKILDKNKNKIKINQKNNFGISHNLEILLNFQNRQKK